MRGGGVAWRFGWALGLALMVLAGSAAAQSRILQQAWWPEPCQRHTLEQAAQQDFIVHEGMLALGYSRCAVWLRLLVAPAGADARTVLRIRPTNLDQIELHDPLSASVRTAGDRHPVPPGEAAGRAWQFNVPGGTAPRHVWLRIETSSTRLIDVQALSPVAAQAQEQLEERVQAAFLALLAVSLLWALVQWLYARDRVVGIFAIKQAFVLGWATLLLGYGPALVGGWLAPTTIDRLTSVLVVTITSLSLWFDRALLSGYAVPALGLRALYGLIALLPLELALMLAGYTSLALAINTGIVVVGVVLIFALALQARRAGPPTDTVQAVLPPRFMAVFYGVIMVAIGAAMGAQSGLTPASPLSLAALYVHGLLTGIGMMVLLSLRARLQARSLRELGALRLQEQQERQHRQEQERLVGMLVHELKTPLAAVRMLLGHGQPSAAQFASAQQALADMDGVLERCAQASQLDADRLRPRTSPCDLPRALVALVARQPASERIALECSVALQDAPQFDTDPQWLMIILGNLLDNACKYGAPDGQVLVTAERDAGASAEAGITINVSNPPGPAGWPDAQQVFTKYYRSPHAQRKTGSGLGLYLVAGLAQRLGGRIRYAPTSERVRFRLWLPG